jgi:hypothetical protein
MPHCTAIHSTYDCYLCSDIQCSSVSRQKRLDYPVCFLVRIMSDLWFVLSYYQRLFLYFHKVHAFNSHFSKQCVSNGNYCCIWVVISMNAIWSVFLFLLSLALWRCWLFTEDTQSAAPSSIPAQLTCFVAIHNTKENFKISEKHKKYVVTLRSRSSCKWYLKITSYFKENASPLQRSVD